MSLIEVRNINKTFSGPNGTIVRAVSDVSFSIEEGEVLGVVGESGCGKSTLGHSILRLIEPDSGSIIFDGTDMATARRRELKRRRRDVQIIFQDPFGSLNPRHRVGHIIGEPLIVHRIGTKTDRQARVAELLDLVGLPADACERYAHEFSGGQRQRIAIARALALNPRLVVADEAVSALDVSIQSQILNLIADLRRKLGLSILFISHDLSVIRHVSDRIAVMYLGRFVEFGPAHQVMENPQHPYTCALLSAVPTIEGERHARPFIVAGEPPDPANPPDGCAFHSRCPKAMDICIGTRPELISRRGNPAGTQTACHLYKN